MEINLNQVEAQLNLLAQLRKEAMANQDTKGQAELFQAIEDGHLFIEVGIPAIKRKLFQQADTVTTLAQDITAAELLECRYRLQEALREVELQIQFIANGSRRFQEKAVVTSSEPSESLHKDVSQ